MNDILTTQPYNMANEIGRHFYYHSSYRKGSDIFRQQEQIPITFQYENLENYNALYIMNELHQSINKSYDS